MSRDVFAVVSDLHCGSMLGLCPPDGVQLDDGGRYMPSNAQVRLWECWLDYWATVKKSLKKGDRLIAVCNGDAADGWHHNSSQIVSNNLPVIQHEITLRTLAPMLELEPSNIIFIRGTETHVGSSGAYEERLARDLEAVKDRETGSHSHWHFQTLSQDVLLDFAHHGSVGKLPWTRNNPSNALAARVFMAAARARVRHPDLVIRSHMHQEADSGEAQPVRVIQTRGWQLSTAFIHKIAAGSLPEVGGLVISCEAGRYELQKVRFEWKRAEPWKPKGKSTSPNRKSSPQT